VFLIYLAQGYVSYCHHLVTFTSLTLPLLQSDAVWAFVKMFMAQTEEVAGLN
jgi:hypothetical protein